MASGDFCFLRHLSSMISSFMYADMCFRFDPYTRLLSEERYEQQEMQEMREAAIDEARDCLPSRSLELMSAHGSAPAPRGRFGLVLSTLGRQGSPKIFEARRLASRHGTGALVLSL